MDFDSIVVGAGVIGLAVGRALARSGRRVLVLERNAAIGEETSSRNSEVIHAGIYYPQASLKARLCVRGRQLLYDYCTQHAVPFKRPGKLIVAAGPAQAEALRQLLQLGLGNGVHDLQLIEREQLQLLEPELDATLAILSPSTGIIDSHQFMLALQADLENTGATLVLRSPVSHGEVVAGGFRLQVGGAEPTTVTCKQLVNCAGLGAQALSATIDGVPAGSIPPLYLSRGCYFSLQDKSPFRHLVYPMPSDEGLGVHLTLDLQGGARFGPDSQWLKQIDYRVDPGRAAAFANAIRSYYPGLRPERLVPAYAGIRPRIAGPGEAPADFLLQTPALHGIAGWCALYGIESPGLTAALAIAEQVCDSL